MEGRVMRAVRAAIAALWATALPAAAQPVHVEGIEIIDSGMYESPGGETIRNTDSPTGEMALPTNKKLVAATNDIAGKVGVEFGFRYVIKGKPAGAEVPLDFAFTYPEPRQEPCACERPITASQFSETKKIGETIYLGYSFKKFWEILPGTWTFTVSYDGKEMAKHSFTVSAP
ncbi:DUF3859 domain-containing protein [Roseixanthobacter liquoris]|uniref:DUF3859 domain-containing protein n=1 Tax=Roseixanthobacter liquoris TaxID=3119921 RepID=UPI0037292431